MRNSKSTLSDLIGSVVRGMGYEFVGCELGSQSRGNSILRVYIDKEKGVTLDDCSRVSYQISAMLDVEDPIQGRYALEVSSPGLDRPLFEIAHYHKFIGKQIKVRLHTPLNDRRNFVGTLVKVEGNDIHILVDQINVVLPFSSIEKAKVIADVVGNERSTL